jgi:hypothetical protein
MNISNFSLEFELNTSEIQKLNKMYFKHLYKQRILVTSCIVIFFLIFFDLGSGNDLMEGMIRSVVLIVFFLMVQYSFVNSVYKIICSLAKKLVKSETFINKYRLNCTNSFICVHSPLGAFTHNWTKIEKAILTKDFFFLYVKEKNNYIISISNRNANGRNMDELIAFVENNVTHVTKV